MTSVAATAYDGDAIVGFEEQGWYYRITGGPGVDHDTLIEFAQAFERPAITAALSSRSSSNATCEANGELALARVHAGS